MNGYLKDLCKSFKYVMEYVSTWIIGLLGIFWGIINLIGYIQGNTLLTFDQLILVIGAIALVAMIPLAFIFVTMKHIFKRRP